MNFPTTLTYVAWHIQAGETMNANFRALGEHLQGPSEACEALTSGSWMLDVVGHVM